MKNIFLICLIALPILACKSDQKENTKIITERNVSDSVQYENVPQEEQIEEEKKPKKISMAGTFIRNDDDKGTEVCQCNCLEVNFETPKALCIDAKTGLAINVRFEKQDDSSLHIFYIGPEKKEPAPGDKLPWDKFDTAQPIATIAYSGNNSLELDWKGFNIDGQIATDYAIYGKKNLEGKYVRKEKN